MPQDEKPRPRRASIISLVLFSLIAGFVWYVRSDYGYLKWRFVGGEEELIGHALETEDISTGQVVALVNSGATYEVRFEALRTVGESPKFKRPLSDSAVLAIARFAHDLPTDLSRREDASAAIARIALRSSRAEVRTLLRAVAADPSPSVRLLVALEMASGGPEWAVACLRPLLTDSDPEVRGAAVSVVDGSHRRGVRVSSLLPTVRAMLQSSTETEAVRLQALWTLFLCGQLGEEQITPYLTDAHRSVAVAAKRLRDRMRSTSNDDGRQLPPNPADGSDAARPSEGEGRPEVEGE